MSHFLRVFLAVALLLALMAACGEDPAEEADVLISLTDEVIVPGYTAAAQEFRQLGQALDSLCAAPSDAALAEARQAWRDARVTWAYTKAAGFGPVMDRRSLRLIDWFPVETDRIEAMLSERPATTDDDVQNVLASTQRGLGAIEYVLFDDAALAQLADSSSPRCPYLAALGRVASSELRAVLDEWDVARETGPPYKDFLTGRSSSSMLTSAAVAEVVRTQVFLARAVMDMQLAVVLGLRGDSSDPAAFADGPAGNALHDLRAEVRGMRDIYLGANLDGSLGIADLVAPLSDETNERMRGHFQDVMAALDAVEGPLNDAVQNRSSQVQAIYDRIAELRRTLNTEVVSLLGVAVGFSDTDGDSQR